MLSARSSPVGAFTAVAAATALGWAALIAVGTTGLEAICGGSGLALALGTALMWGLMAATMMLPCAVHEICDAARHGWRSATLFALGCIAPPTLLAIAAGTLLGPLAIGTPALLVIAGAALVAEAGLARGPVGIGSAVAMLCLQLIGGAMDLGWMALVAVWMLVLALAPARRLATAAAGAVLLGLAAFGSF
jgi:predicted metal-binding membrane protein